LTKCLDQGHRAPGRIEEQQIGVHFGVPGISVPERDPVGDTVDPGVVLGHLQPLAATVHGDDRAAGSGESDGIASAATHRVEDPPSPCLFADP
jgi:hypothetical protein